MTARSTDIGRQISVTSSAVVAVAAAVIGSGAWGGTPISEAADGALAADATYVAPGGTAFTIWSLLYAGFLAFAVWQILPAQRENPRLRATSWLIALSLLLNAAWIATVQVGWVTVSVAVIVALLVTLAAVFIRCLRSRPADVTEAVLLDGVMGLYLGWIVVATVANTAAALNQATADFGLGAQPWAVIVVAGAAVVGAALSVIGRGRVAAPAAIVWGLAWIAIARLDAPQSTAVAVAAAAAALVVVSAAVTARIRRPNTPTPALGEAHLEARVWKKSAQRRLGPSRTSR
ncbi:tryptophan-rich sensory protein [Nocardia cyriacigeorgica]|uniref:tryptophan-rich sensory protein n=1 Tax=Nocardia cyriacigeorgica TaxID=135487 RepID=UPI001E62B305|nr:tryptophan-rich sensory protein [Nocardia cyriacigeorgica]